MDQTLKRAAKAAWKERKSVAGIYALRYEATGASWVGSSPNLDAVPNRLWFILRLGSHPNAALQTAWARVAGEGFICETLETLDCEDDPPYVRDKRLKERALHWQAVLGAHKLP